MTAIVQYPCRSFTKVQAVSEPMFLASRMSHQNERWTYVGWQGRTRAVARHSCADPDNNDGSTAEVIIWDPIEHRIEVFHADTGIPVNGGGSGDIVERATELLKSDGWIVHSVEPDPGRGYAAIVELTED